MEQQNLRADGALKQLADCEKLHVPISEVEKIHQQHADETVALQGQIRSLRSNSESSQENNFQLQEKLASLSAELKTLREQKESVDKEISNLGSELTKVNAEHENCKQIYPQQLAEREEVEDSKRKLTNELSEVRSTAEEDRQKCSKYESDLQRYKEIIDRLKEEVYLLFEFTDTRRPEAASQTGRNLSKEASQT